ncbi:MAG: hypothetical protein C6H99_06335 [Epsilonproteobacteria bacterium]|nr:hypothetical protein [Campylobacterota bacterium]NPA63782.1 hypothetical protein [Campylobacterota bacterium]
MAKEEAMDLEKIKNLHQKCQKQKSDLYTFLEEELPQLNVEDRLKVMAEVLNEHLEEYEYDQADKLKREEYSITKFYPKK